MNLKQSVALLSIVAVVAMAAAQSVFDMPKLFPQHRRYLAQFVNALQQNDLLAAETAARSAVKIFPRDANWHYNVGCVCARDHRPEEALSWIQQAVELGFTDVKQLKEDADLVGVRTLSAFSELLKKAEAAQASPTRNPTLSSALTETVALGGELEVVPRNTQWDWNPLQGGYMTTRVALVGDRMPNADAYDGPYADLIRPWMREGTAAGNAGELYVNRDEDRTQVAVERFPLLTSVLYGEEAQYCRAHVGAANGVFSSGWVCPVVGTSSLSLANTPFWRSIPRLIATESAADLLAFRFAVANQLYIYDVSSDYSRQFKGDLLTAMLPQILISADTVNETPDAKAANEQLAELIFAGLAAMHPETKQEMVQRGLLVPTMQMLLRKHVKGATDYCSATAHPAVFDPALIDGERFVKAAHALKTDDLPATFQLAVRRESMPRQYIDYFDLPGSERVSDTPWSIKRVVRGLEKTRKLTVSAAGIEPGLTYHWFVVSGDPEKIRIRPLTKDASLTTLEVDYHGEFVRDGVATRHVDIACVAMRKGKPASAPLFVSFRYLANERRTYDEKGRIQRVDYTASKDGFVYEDPVLTAYKNWSDAYSYDANGQLLGWTRTRPEGDIQHFDARGRRVLETHPDGTPRKVVRVSYFPRRDAGSDAVSSPAIELLQADTEQVIDL